MQLLAEARPLLANAAALRRRVTRVARGPAAFVVGFMPGLIVTAPIRALISRHPELSVEVIRTTWDDQTDLFHDGRADVSFVRLPVDQQGLQIQHLHTEARIAVLPADHRLAGKTTISITDLADEHLLQNPHAVPEWRDIATELRARTRRAEPVFHSVEEKLEHVAAGHGVVILPRSVTSFYSRADVVHVTIEDIAPNQVCLAWDSARPDRVIHEFAAIAAEHRTAIVSPPTSRP